MAANKRKIIGILLVLVLSLGAVLGHYAYDPWGFYFKVSEDEAALRQKVVQTAQSWLGANEADGSHRAILAVYNAHEPLAVGYTVQDTDSWCSAFVSAVAIQCGITDIFPTECGCQRHIDLFRSLNRWQEDDNHIPLPGDLIFYDWEEDALGEADGWSDHVGIVVGTKWPFVKVIEGNCDDAVRERVILLGNVTIRGYGLPDYGAAVTE